MAHMKCPKCGSKNFKNLRILYEDGTKKYERSHVSSRGYDSTTTSTTQTLLAKSVSPPTAPKVPPKKSDYKVAMGVMGLIAFILVSGTFSIITKIIGVAVIGYICRFLNKEGIKNTEWNNREYPKIYEEYKRDYEKWQHDYDTWQHSYICKKCGTIFTD